MRMGEAVFANGQYHNYIKIQLISCFLRLVSERMSLFLVTFYWGKFYTILRVYMRNPTVYTHGTRYIDSIEARLRFIITVYAYFQIIRGY
jgi:hypothetical protein